MTINPQASSLKPHAAGGWAGIPNSKFLIRNCSPASAAYQAEVSPDSKPSAKISGGGGKGHTTPNIPSPEPS